MTAAAHKKNYTVKTKSDEEKRKDVSLFYKASKAAGAFKL
jgi:hypothetical protein